MSNVIDMCEDLREAVLQGDENSKKEVARVEKGMNRMDEVVRMCKEEVEEKVDKVTKEIDIISNNDL